MTVGVTGIETSERADRRGVIDWKIELFSSNSVGRLVDKKQESLLGGPHQSVAAEVGLLLLLWSTAPDHAYVELARMRTGGQHEDEFRRILALIGCM